jgi:hypothetical protein
MTVTTTALTARRSLAAGTGWPKLLARTLGAEWTKLRSVRSTYGSLVAAVVVTVAIAALAAWAITTDDQPNPAPATQLAAVGASVGQFGWSLWPPWPSPASSPPAASAPPWRPHRRGGRC